MMSKSISVVGGLRRVSLAQRGFAAFGMETIERSLGRQAASHLIKSFDVGNTALNNSPTTRVSDPDSLQTWEWVAGIDRCFISTASSASCSLTCRLCMRVYIFVLQYSKVQ
jgi:hypothetical protein